MMIDTHCHLDFEEFDDDRDAVIKRYREAGGDWMILSVTGPASTQRAIALCGQYARMRCLAGLHPHEADQCSNRTVDALRNAAQSEYVVGIGEVGLDFFREGHPAKIQEHTFRTMLALSRECHLPVVLHIREAHDRALAVLRSEGRCWTGIAHSFTGTPDHALQYLELGFHVAFNGIVTFPKAENVRASLSVVPPDRLLVETDAPYLSPVPMRGKRNEPVFVRHILTRIAGLKQCPVSDLTDLTAANAMRLFGL